MEKPPFLRVMTITMVILLAILLALSLWIIHIDKSIYTILHVVPIALYHFLFCLMLNLLGYNIYKKNQIGIVICSLFLFLLPFLIYFYFDFLSIISLSTSSKLGFLDHIIGIVGQALFITVLFLGIYVFIYPKLWKTLAVFGAVLIIWMLLFQMIPSLPFLDFFIINLLSP